MNTQPENKIAPKCLNCGAPFKPYKDWQKFCSQKCGRVVRMSRYWDKRLGGDSPRFSDKELDLIKKALVHALRCLPGIEYDKDTAASLMFKLVGRI